MLSDVDFLVLYENSKLVLWSKINKNVDIVEIHAIQTSRVGRAMTICMARIAVEGNSRTRTYVPKAPDISIGVASCVPCGTFPSGPSNRAVCSRDVVSPFKDSKVD